jgi:Alginate export
MRNRKIGLSVLFTLIITMFIPVVTNAGIEIGNGVSIDVQVRERTEVDGKDFNSDTDMIEYSYLRTRLGLEFTKIENTTIYLQFQDSRDLGLNSSRTTPDNNLGVHQAFIKFKCRMNNKLWFQIGRFQVAYGRERVLGSVGWSNVGRTFDGLRAGLACDKATLDFLMLKIRDRAFETFVHPGDQILYGLYAQLLKKHLHLFILLDHDHLELLNGDASLNRWTLGGYYHRKMSRGLDIKMDFAYQMGSYHAVNYDGIAAYMLAVEFGYQSDSKMKPGIAGGFDYTSGENVDDPDDKLNTYYNGYYTGHAYRGFMDEFVINPPSGLIDLFIRMSIAPNERMVIALDIHHFQSAQDYQFGSDDTKSIGQELDFTGKCKIYDGLGCQMGVSLFFPSDDWRGDEADMATWFYGMLTATID